MKAKSDLSDGTMIERDLDDVPFTMIPNALLADTDISWKAKGVISYLLGKPAHWKARTKDIENHGTGGETEVRSALRELRNAGYARLERHTNKGRVVKFVYRVANRRKYTEDGGRQVEIPSKTGRPLVGEPEVENPHLDDSLVDGSRVGNRDNRKNECRKKDLKKNEKIKEKMTSNNKVRASGDGSTTPDSTPSAISGPRSSAEQFIQDYRAWGKAAQITPTVVQEDRQALQQFFADNDHITPAELIAIMLAAWMMNNTITPGTESHEAYWHCRRMSKRIKTFVQYLPTIQDELEWKGQPQAEKIMRIAHQRFLQQKAA